MSTPAHTVTNRLTLAEMEDLVGLTQSAQA
jgi:hypothetical protein